MTATQKKKIMVVSNSRKCAERLKQELEERKVCDVVDVHITTNPKKVLEELIVNKGKEEYNYRMFILDVRDTGFEFAKNLKHNFPTAHLVVLSRWGKPKTTNEMRSNAFHSFYKPNRSIEECERLLREDYKIKDGADLGCHLKEHRAEFARGIEVEQLGFNHNYIKTPIRNYGHVTSKINQILVAGACQGRGIKYYSSPQAERRAKSDKAFEIIMQHDVFKTGSGHIIRDNHASLSTFKMRLEMYGKDISKNTLLE